MVYLRSGLVAGRGFFRFTFSYEMGHVVKALNLPWDGRRFVKRLKKAPPEEADRIKRRVARLLGAEVFYVYENRFEPAEGGFEKVEEVEEVAEDALELVGEVEEVEY